MFIEKVYDKRRPNYPPQILLRETYRETGEGRSRVKHRTLLNLTHHPASEVAALELALRYKTDVEKLRSLLEGGVEMRQGRSVGAVWVLRELAVRAGLSKALGSSAAGRLSLWMVLARVINQGSRLSAVRLAEEHAACEVLGLAGFSEKDLYASLDWLDARQCRVEQSLFRTRRGSNPPTLYLYDVTSSYLEGECNAYGAYGYNRDKKRGKQQIVVGLLLDDEGWPVSVEVFSGNTPDVLTVESQVRKLAERFGAQGVTLVGDRGMLKSAQIAELSEESFHYLTAVTKPQIESLIKDGVLQLGMFDEKLCEVSDRGVRYLLRRNPVRAAELAVSREDKLRCLQVRAARRNAYLGEHPRAKVETGVRDLNEYAKRLKIAGWVRIVAEERVVVLVVDEEALAAESRLDGCYVLKTDVPAETAGAAQLHARYKDLTEVERAFRVMKTVHLEVRPVYVQNEAHTRAHVFIVMLAFIIRRHLEQAWKNFDLTVEEGIAQLSTLCAEEMLLPGQAGFLRIPTPRQSLQPLFAALNITPPTVLPRRLVQVATKKKLPPRRKKL